MTLLNGLQGPCQIRAISTDKPGLTRLESAPYAAHVRGCLSGVGPLPAPDIGLKEPR